MNALNNSQGIDETVNGRADLLDFFPVWLDIGRSLAKIGELPGSGGKIEIKLRHAGDALNFVTTGLSTNDAGSYLVSEVPGLASAETKKITSDGVAFPGSFVDAVRADPSKGVILIEGRSETSEPLALEIRRGGKKVSATWSSLRPSPTGTCASLLLCFRWCLRLDKIFAFPLLFSPRTTGTVCRAAGVTDTPVSRTVSAAEGRREGIQREMGFTAVENRGYDESV